MRCNFAGGSVRGLIPFPSLPFSFSSVSAALLPVCAARGFAALRGERLTRRRANEFERILIFLGAVSRATPGSAVGRQQPRRRRSGPVSGGSGAVGAAADGGLPPRRDPAVRRLQPAHRGQVHPQGPGPALAQLLPQVCRLPDAAGRPLLLPGRQRLLQGGLLQVSTARGHGPPKAASPLPAKQTNAQLLIFKWNFSKIFILF